jgi:CHAT domain-containing protein
MARLTHAISACMRHIVVLVAAGLTASCIAAPQNLAMVINYSQGRADLDAAGVTDLDYENLAAGNLASVKARYEQQEADRLTLAQLSLLCDVELKYDDIDRTTTCLSRLEARLAVETKGARPGRQQQQIQGKRAMIALASGDIVAARDLSRTLDGAGGRYLFALTSAQLGDGAAARPIAEHLALQYEPGQIYYAASLFAAMNECDRTLALMFDPSRRLIQDYGVGVGQDILGGDTHAAPFRLDIFDEFNFGYFSKFSYAPRANVYVEFTAARCLFEVNRTGEAKVRFKRLVGLPEIAAFRDILWMSEYYLGRVAETDRDFSDANAHYANAIRAIETVRQTIRTEAGRIGFIGDKQDVYRRLIGLQLQLGDTAGALGTVESARSRALVDMLAGLKRFAAPELDDAESAALVQNLDRAESDLTLAQDTLDLRGGGGNVPPLLAKIEIARRLIAARSPNLAALVSPSVPGVAEMQALLQPNEAALSYFEENGRWLRFLITRRKVDVVSLGAVDLESMIGTFRAQLSNYGSNDFMTLSRTLHDLLIGDSGPEITKLTIVAYGPLHYLPFAALYDGRRFLIDRYALRELPSLSVLAELGRHSGPAGRGMLVVGNPDRRDSRYDLPGAEAEARAIAGEVPDARLLLREQATIGNVLAAAHSVAALHIAGHGDYNEKSPLQSRLLLTPSGGDSGDLSVADLYGVRLSARQIVLSACDAALGQGANGDEIIGLVRGFLFAGGDSVIGSLWDIEDQSTALLMEEFYRLRQHGASTASALQGAQQATRAKFPHPYFWSAFVLDGLDG